VAWRWTHHHDQSQHPPAHPSKPGSPHAYGRSNHRGTCSLSPLRIIHTIIGRTHAQRRSAIAMRDEAHQRGVQDFLKKRWFRSGRLEVESSAGCHTMHRRERCHSHIRHRL
jgi:hypothetical protein